LKIFIFKFEFVRPSVMLKSRTSKVTAQVINLQKVFAIRSPKVGNLVRW